MTAPRLYVRIYLHGLLLLLLISLSVGVAVHIEGRARRHTDPVDLVRHLGRWLSRLADPTALAEEVRRAGEDFDIRLTLYAEDGSVLAASGRRTVPPLPAAELTRLRQTDEGWIRHQDSVGVGAGEGRYLMMAVVPRRTLLAHATMVTAGLALALAIGSLPLARAIARPIERLSAAARRLGDGDLSVRSGIRRNDEFGTLAAAFDTMADRLQRLVEGQRELLVSVSHELRTPLARLGVTLGLAAEADVEKGREYLQQAAADIDELTRLVEDTLATARLDAGGPAAMRLEPIDPADLMDAAAGRFRRAHPQRRLTVEAAPALPWLRGDRALLVRVLDNLLDNARKYSDAEVHLSARAADRGVALEVQDRGIGIDAADLPRLFTPFFRTDRSRSRDTGGVGLGLALAKRIITAHGGTIEVESRPDEGTVVRLWLPSSPVPA